MIYGNVRNKILQIIISSRCQPINLPSIYIYILTLKIKGYSSEIIKRN